MDFRRPRRSSRFQTRPVRTALVWIWFFLAVGLSLRGQAPTLGPAEPFSGSQSRELLNVLGGAGHRLKGSAGDELVRIWLRTDAGKLEDGVFVGVASVLNPIQDARHRTVPAGTYSLRYVEIPPSSEHRGCMSQPRFLVLMPLESDTEAPERVSYGELLISDRSHPLILQLVNSRTGSTSVSQSRTPGQVIVHLPWAAARPAESIGILLNY
jgi:hypothetical protein